MLNRHQNVSQGEVPGFINRRHLSNGDAVIGSPSRLKKKPFPLHDDGISQELPASGCSFPLHSSSSTPGPSPRSINPPSGARPHPTLSQKLLCSLKVRPKCREIPAFTSLCSSSCTTSGCIWDLDDAFNVPELPVSILRPSSLPVDRGYSVVQRQRLNLKGLHIREFKVLTSVDTFIAPMLYLESANQVLLLQRPSYFSFISFLSVRKLE